MKKLIKKTVATTLSIAGVLLMVPSAFCVPRGSDFTEGHVDNYSAMIVGKYFNNMEDLYNLAMVSKKFRNILLKYRYNPVPITSRSQLEVFPSLETLYLGRCEDDFISTFPNDKIKVMIYTEGSFDANQFEQVLVDNKIVYGKGKNYSRLWKCELELIDGNSANGCNITFTNNDRKIIFKFAPPYNGTNLMTLSEYNEFMKNYGFVAGETGRCISGRCIEGFNTHMADYVFRNNCSLWDVQIYGFTKNVGKGAFQGCKHLVSVSLPNAVEIIEEDAFKDCEYLKNVDFSKATKTIGKHAFENCKGLREIKLRGPIGTIAEGAFKGCHNLESLNFPRSITSVEKSAFEDCKQLKAITISGSVTDIGERAFAGCENLERIVIPYSITEIKNNTFENCKNLKRITISTSVKNIAENAFEGCTSLNDIKFNQKHYESVDSFMQAFNTYRASHS